MFDYYVVSAGLNWMDANLARLVMTSRDRPPHLRARLIDMYVQKWHFALQ